jgi:hypothetical protein
VNTNSNDMRITDRRIGWVNVTVSIINDAPDMIHDMFLDFIPIKTEHDFMTGIITYHGISPQFEVLQEGFAAPQYNAIMTTDGGTSRFSHFLKVT